MVEGVLLVEVTQERHERRVQHIAVEDELDEGRQKMHGQKGGEEGRPAGGQLRPPDAGEDQGQDREHRCQRQDDGGDEKRDREFRLRFAPVGMDRHRFF